MTTYYASSTGNDANNGLSTGAPKTLSGGYAVCNAGDTLRLLPGTYQQKLTLNRSGTSGNPITVTSHDSNDKAFISGGGTNVLATTLEDKLIIINANYNVLDGVEAGNFIRYDPTAMNGGPAWGAYPVYIESGAAHNTIIRCDLHDAGGHGIVCCGPYALIEDNDVYNIGLGLYYYIGLYPPNIISWGSGIGLQTRFDLSQDGAWSANKNIGGTVKNNRVYNIYGEGIIVMRQYGASSTIKVHGNEIRNCMAPHLYITNSDNVEMYDNIASCPDYATLFGTVRGPGRGLSVGNEYDPTQNPDGCRYLTIYNNLVYGTASPLTYFTQAYYINGVAYYFPQLKDSVITYNHFLDGKQGGGGYGNLATTVNFTTGTISNVQFRNNVVTQTNGSYSIAAWNTTTGITFSNNRWGRTPGYTLGSGDSVGDPQIALAGATNPLTKEYFRPLTGSVLIGAGVAVSGLTTDYEGTTRANPPTIGGLEGASSSDYDTTAAPWATVDIGSVPTAGTDEYSPSLLTYRQVGYGADVWSTADAFCFTYREITGDFTFQYRVASATGGGVYSKAGSDVRVALTAGSRHITINQIQSGLIQRLLRTTDGGSTGYTNGSTGNRWQQVVRSGNIITTSHSADGSTWTTLAVDDITGWGTTLYVGRMACANDASASVTVLYDNVALSAYEDAIGTISFGVDLAGVASPTAIVEATGTISFGFDLLGNTASASIVDAIGTISIDFLLNGVADPNVGDVSDSTVFGNYKRALIGTAPQTTYGPVTAGTQSSLLGCAISNRKAAIVKVSVALVNGASTYYRAYNLPIQPNSVLYPFASGLRLDLKPGDKLVVSADQESAVDSVVSYVERPP